MYHISFDFEIKSDTSKFESSIYSQQSIISNTHTHTHTYIYMCVCG